MKKQLEAERLEKLRILREQHELKRQTAAAERKTQLEKEEQNLQRELSAAPHVQAQAELPEGTFASLCISRPLNVVALCCASIHIQLTTM